MNFARETQLVYGFTGITLACPSNALYRPWQEGCVVRHVCNTCARISPSQHTVGTTAWIPLRKPEKNSLQNVEKRRNFPSWGPVFTGESPIACVGGARQAAVKRGEASDLPVRAKDLIAAQVERPIFDIHSSHLPQCTRDAQQTKPPRFLSDDEIALLGAGGRAAKVLRDQCSSIVAEARKEILKCYAGIDKPGGGLYPEFRADACWRDMENFVRVASYGCCAESEPYLDEEGCRIMNDIYNELEVPRPAMLTGVHAAMKKAVLLLPDDDEGRACVEQSFRQLTDMLAGMDRR